MTARARKPPKMRQTVVEPQSETTVKELSIERTNKHVPLATDGSIAAPGTVVSKEQIENAGAVNEEAAAWNRKRAQIVDAKRNGQAGVEWGTDDPIELWGMVKDVWHSGISIRVMRELPDQVTHPTLKLDQFRSGDDMMAHVRKAFHKRSPEATYKFQFVVGNSTSVRAVGRTTLPDTMDEEPPMQQPPQQQPPPGYVYAQPQPQPQQPQQPQPVTYAQQPQQPQPIAYAAPPPSPSIEEIIARVVSALAPALHPPPATHAAPVPAPSSPGDPYAMVFRLMEANATLSAQIATLTEQVRSGAFAHAPQQVAQQLPAAPQPQSLVQQIENLLEIRKLFDRLSPPAAATAGALVASAAADGGGGGEGAGFMTVMPVDPNDPDGPALTFKPNGDVHLGATMLNFLSKAPGWARKGVDMAIDTQKKLEEARQNAQQPQVIDAQGRAVQQQPPPPRRQPNLPAPPPPAPVNGQVVHGAAHAPAAATASSTPGFE